MESMIDSRKLSWSCQEPHRKSSFKTKLLRWRESVVPTSYAWRTYLCNLMTDQWVIISSNKLDEIPSLANRILPHLHVEQRKLSANGACETPLHQEMPLRVYGQPSSLPTSLIPIPCPLWDWHPPPPPKEHRHKGSLGNTWYTSYIY